jgi:hypothetical protein
MSGNFPIFIFNYPSVGYCNEYLAITACVKEVNKFFDIFNIGMRVDRGTT